MLSLNLRKLLVLVAAALVTVGVLVARGSADTVPAVPGALWSALTPFNDPPVAVPSGQVLAPSCQSLTADGGLAWSVAWGCRSAVGDAQGNVYIGGGGTQFNDSRVESLDQAGNVRWVSTPLPGSFVVFGLGQPVLGWNGSVYFIEWDGGTQKIVGFDTQTGAITLDRAVSDITGLYTFSAGLIVVLGGSDVQYLDYSGNVVHTYQAGSPLFANLGYTNIGGADGAVFLAGYPGGCGPGSQAAIEKFLPTGQLWDWTDPTPGGCNNLWLAATTDGGVILGRNKSEPYGGATFSSFGFGGLLRWTHDASRVAGFIPDVGRVLPPAVDKNGVVALPSENESTCQSGVCQSGLIAFLSQETGAQVFPSVSIINPQGSFNPDGLAIGPDRGYMEGHENSSTPPSGLFGFQVAGLSTNYRITLQPGGSAPIQGGTNPGTLPTPFPPGTPTPNPGDLGACGPVAGSAGKRLLAAIKCTAAQTFLEAKCGSSLALKLALPSKLKTVKGLYDLRKVPSKFVPLAKIYNRLSTVKILPSAPKGFRTAGQIRAKLEKARSALDVLKLLPSLRKAIPAYDFNAIALDMSDFLGLRSCVQAVLNALK